MFDNRYDIQLLNIAATLISTLESYDNKGLQRISSISGRHITTIRALIRDWRCHSANPTLHTMTALYAAIYEDTQNAI